MGLRAAEHEAATDIGISAPDVDAAAAEADIAGSQRRTSVDAGGRS